MPRALNLRDTCWSAFNYSISSYSLTPAWADLTPPLQPTQLSKDGMNALSLAVCGDHPDVIKVLVDEFNVPLPPIDPVSSMPLKSADTHRQSCTSCFGELYVCVTMLHMILPTLHVQQLGKTVFHIAVDQNSRECLKLLVYHYKIDPDQPDIVSYSIITCTHDGMYWSIVLVVLLTYTRCRLGRLPSIMLRWKAKQIWLPS